jgi:hypothetical protein
LLHLDTSGGSFLGGGESGFARFFPNAYHADPETDFPRMVHLHHDEATMRMILAGLCLLCAANTTPAQTIRGGDFERYLRPGYNSPSDGQPFSHRYGYDPGMSSFYFHGDAYRLGYLEYLDRVDRAEKFGYCVPYDCRYEQEAVVVEQVVPSETVSEPPGTQGRYGRFRRR